MGLTRCSETSNDFMEVLEFVVALNGNIQAMNGEPLLAQIAEDNLRGIVHSRWTDWALHTVEALGMCSGC